MRITTRLRLLASGTIAALVAMAILLVLGIFQLRNEKDTDALIGAIKDNYLRGEVARDQYFLHRETRLRTQWEGSMRNVDRLLRQAEAQIPGDRNREQLRRMRRNAEDSVKIFQRIVENAEALKQSGVNRDAYRELDNRLYSQLLLKFDANVAAVAALEGEHTDLAELTYQQLVAGITGLMLAMGLTAILTATHIDRLVRKRLAPLHAGAKQVSAGDLAYRIPSDGADEFAEVARSVNDMTDKLESRTRQLEAEIRARELSFQALREQEQRYRSILTTAIDGFCLVDTQGHLLEVNETYCRMTGYSEQELLSMRLFDLECRENAAETAAHIQRVIAIGEDRFETMHRRKDGSTIEFSVNVKYRPIDGGRFVAFYQDITPRKQAEAARALLESQLRDAHKLEAIGTLAGGIAHDFNNILATILGNAELARQDAHGNPAALQSLAEIHKAGTRARGLVQQILAFSRHQPTVRRPTTLPAVIGESVRLLRATLPARLTIDVRCDAEVPAVLADANLIQQCLINLATNALQAIPAGSGRILITLESALLDARMAETHPELRALHARQPGKTVRLTVADDGVGMNPETLSRIFEPFFTTKAFGEGTGLGLSVVHGIIQTHEGAIVVKSAPGKGTTFAIYLPAVDANAVPAREPAPVRESTVMSGMVKVPHILYLDDEEPLVYLVERLLHRRGFRVSGYISQREALAALRAEPGEFDLVVSDYNMPGMSGLDVAREVHKIRADLPVAIISGYIDETLKSQAGAAGVRELIFKANDVDELCDAFARLANAVNHAVAAD